MSVKKEPSCHELDTRGTSCPEPVMMLHAVVRDAQIGDRIHVQATDPATTKDIPRFCHFLGHELVAETRQGDEFHYEIIKRGSS